MLTCSWKDYHLSRLMLGTVQFGMPYGVANRTGQPEYRDVLLMVAAAIEGGVNCFDTAAVYGTSEEVLGRALRELGVIEKAVVVTKVRPLSPSELIDNDSAARAIEQSVAESRRRLGMDCLPVVLFHREADAVYLDVLEVLKERGWLRYAGVSCDNRAGPAVRFAVAGNAAALQLPASLIDRRHQQSGIFRKAQANGVAVFIRSVFLQGLLLMPEENVPPPLQGILPARRRMQEIARQGGMTLGELAVRYMLSQDGVTCVLTGVETIGQVCDNLVMFDRGPLPSDMLRAIDADVPDLPEAIITPAQWQGGWK